MITPFAQFADSKPKWYDYKKNAPTLPKGTPKNRKPGSLGEFDVFRKYEFEPFLPSYERCFKDVFAFSLYLDQDRARLNAPREDNLFKYPVYCAYRFFAKLEMEKDGLHHNLVKPFLEDLQKMDLKAGLYMRSCVSTLCHNGLDRYSNKGEYKPKTPWGLNKEKNLDRDEVGVDPVDEDSLKVRESRFAH